MKANDTILLRRPRYFCTICYRLASRCDCGMAVHSPGKGCLIVMFECGHPASEVHGLGYCIFCAEIPHSRTHPKLQAAGIK